MGTAAGNPIRLVEPTVSRIHAELRTSSLGIWLRDLDSTNGCRVNGMLTKEALLPENATLAFGDVEGRFEYVNPEPVPVAESGRFGEMLGVSSTMRQLFLVLERCARVDAPVLLTGERGSGKSLAARSIHAQSARSGAPLLSVDCAALPADVTLSGMLSSVRSQALPGVGVAGDLANASGTLILDEIGELPLPVQAKLVRWLEGRSQTDEDSPSPVHGARIISTSQRDLRELVNRGAFREDLYFRTAVIAVELPALRHRAEDIPLLARHFLGRAPWPPELSLEQLQERPWLGNVRELKNCIERTNASDEGPVNPNTAGVAHDSTAVPASGSRLGSDSEHNRLGSYERSALPRIDQPLRSFREQWTDAGEQRYLRALLERTHNNVPEAARLAEVDRTYVYRLIRRHRR